MNPNQPTPSLRQTLRVRCLKLLIDLLLKYLDYGTQPFDHEQAHKWLASTWEHRGFQSYFAARDRAFIRELSGGIGFIEQKRDDYIRKIGQRVELLLLAYKAKKEFDRLMEQQRRRANAEGEEKK